MYIIEIVYKTMYNYFAKRDGYSSGPHLLASGATFLFNMSFLFNCAMIINLAINHKVSLYAMSKGTGLICSGVAIGLNYFLLFKILKFSKNGDGANNLFNISRETSVFGWRIVIVSMVLAMSVPVIWSYFNR